MKKYILILITLFSLSLAAQEFRGTWIARNSLSTKETLQKAIDSLASANFNTVFINVWSRGYPLWKSSVFHSHTGVYIDPLYEGRDILAETIAEAHKHGMSVEAWFEYGFVGGWTGNIPAGQKGPIFNAHPDWVARTQTGVEKDGSNFYWMVHTRHDVQQFLIDMCEEIAQNYDVDGIELDRIRYSSLEYGYDNYTDSLYRAENNGNPPPTVTSDTSWIRWRANKLNDFMQAAYNAIKAINPKVNVSNAPSLYSSSSYTAYVTFCQDWVTWVNTGLVDNVQVQSYVGSVGSFGAILDFISTMIPDKSKIYPAFAVAPNGNTIPPATLLQYVTTTRNKGFKGNAVWYQPDILAVNQYFATTIYPQKNYVPHHPADWRSYYKIDEIADQANVIREGTWTSSTIFGYNGASVYTSNSSPASLKYRFNVPVEGYYEIYAYNVVASNRSDSARYKVMYGEGAEQTVILNQTDINKRRWVKLGDFLLKAGERDVVILTNEGLADGRFLSGDAVYIKLNRRLSGSVTSIDGKESGLIVPVKKKSDFEINAYPNPFNSETLIKYIVQNSSPIKVKLFNLLGQNIYSEELIPAKTGENFYRINGNSLSSGVYFISFEQNSLSETYKLILSK
ncbi:MAG: family 10 glycosylhydrolase [Ignavibacteriaceae bacterium]|nr:family 10 glycosylhydrolase [Ignavibacteriaceae bacterium]